MLSSENRDVLSQGIEKFIVLTRKNNDEWDDFKKVFITSPLSITKKLTHLSSVQIKNVNNGNRYISLFNELVKSATSRKHLTAIIDACFEKLNGEFNFSKTVMAELLSSLACSMSKLDLKSKDIFKILTFKKNGLSVSILIIKLMESHSKIYLWDLLYVLHTALDKDSILAPMIYNLFLQQSKERRSSIGHISAKATDTNLLFYKIIFQLKKAELTQNKIYELLTLKNRNGYTSIEDGIFMHMVLKEDPNEMVVKALMQILQSHEMMEFISPANTKFLIEIKFNLRNFDRFIYSLMSNVAKEIVKRYSHSGKEAKKIAREYFFPENKNHSILPYFTNFISTDYTDIRDFLSIVCESLEFINTNEMSRANDILFDRRFYQDSFLIRMLLRKDMDTLVVAKAVDRVIDNHAELKGFLNKTLRICFKFDRAKPVFSMLLIELNKNRDNVSTIKYFFEKKKFYLIKARESEYIKANYIHFLMQICDVNTICRHLFPLINAGILPDSQFKVSLRKPMYQYICTLPDAMKLAALNNIKDKKHPLGRFFICRKYKFFGTVKKSLSSSFSEEINDELMVNDAVKKAVTVLNENNFENQLDETGHDKKQTEPVVKKSSLSISGSL